MRSPFLGWTTQQWYCRQCNAIHPHSFMPTWQAKIWRGLGYPTRPMWLLGRVMNRLMGTPHPFKVGQ